MSMRVVREYDLNRPDRFTDAKITLPCSDGRAALVDVFKIAGFSDNDRLPSSLYCDSAVVVDVSFLIDELCLLTLLIFVVLLRGPGASSFELRLDRAVLEQIF